MVSRRVEIPVVVERKVTVSPHGLTWLSVLGDLERQLDTGRLYDRDLPAVLTAINAVNAAAERRRRNQ